MTLTKQTASQPQPLGMLPSDACPRASRRVPTAHLSHTQQYSAHLGHDGVRTMLHEHQEADVDRKLAQ